MSARLAGGLVLVAALWLWPAPVAGQGVVEPGAADSAGVEELLSVYRRLHAGRPVRAVRLDAAVLESLSVEQLAHSPVIVAAQARLAASEQEVEATEGSFRPVLDWSVGHNRYATYSRPAVVNARIPIAWDTANPVQTDINLPNGGRGLIWLPSASEWADRDIRIHASRQFTAEQSRAKVGLTKVFPSGLQLRLMELGAGYRYSPKTYHRPWSMSVTNAIAVPLFGGGGEYGLWENIQLLNERADARLARLALGEATTRELSDLLQAYAALRIGRELYRISGRLAERVQEQLADAMLLRERQLLSAYELIRMQNQARDAARQREALAAELVLQASQLDPRNTERDTVELLLPAAWDVEAVLAASRELADRLLAETARPGFVEGLPGLKAAEEVLEQARNELEYARNQQRPHVALTGSLEMFQVDDIGYESLGNALQRNFVEPDGVIWSVGVAGSLPLGSADRARRDAANRRMRAAEADLAATRRDLLQQSRALAARLRAAGEAVEAAREHVRAAAALLEEHATPLYEARRLTRAEHAAFAADLESNRLGFTSACRDYLAALIELAAFAGTPLDPVRTALH